MAKTKKSSSRPGGLAEVAFYYPGPIWYSGESIKNLLLFFDGVALLVPKYMKGRPEQLDPVLAKPLRKQGLLHLLEPESLVDKNATKELATALGVLISSGKFDHLKKDGTAFQELSYSRLGGYGDPELAESILRKFKARKLARDTADGVSIPLHPVVRATVLVLLAQILRPKGPSIGLDLSPATDRPRLVDALSELLSLSATPSSGRVVAFDLETVAPDLSTVPLDEVLDFRRIHAKEYRAYARNLRKFVRELSLLPAKERTKGFADRQEEIRDLAADLKRRGRKAWRKPASFALSVAGAAWTMGTGDPIGALLATAAALAGGTINKRPEVTAYSYLFRAQEPHV